MQYPALIPAVFIRRNNRFTAEVQLERGITVTAHVPTTGRLTGALRPGCRVWLADAHHPNRKTAYTLVLTELEHGGLCSINASMVNQLFAAACAQGRLEAFSYDYIEKEVTHGHSRLDFRLRSDNSVCWVEVKSVTYVEDGVGLFPDAPTVRGQRHLEELVNLAAGGDRACAVFVAQRGDAQRFAPHEAVDPAFAVSLRRAQQAGVEVHAYRCDVSLAGIDIAQAIPVDL